MKVEVRLRPAAERDPDEAATGCEAGAPFAQRREGRPPRLPVFAGVGGLTPQVADTTSNRVLLDAMGEES